MTLRMLPIPSAPGYFAREDGEILAPTEERGVFAVVKRSVANGRPSVRLAIEGTVSRKSPARLVCEAFHGPEPFNAYPDFVKFIPVKYKDGNPCNTKPDNLSWARAYATPQAIEKRLTHSLTFPGISNEKKFRAQQRLDAFLSVKSRSAPFIEGPEF